MPPLTRCRAARLARQEIPDEALAEEAALELARRDQERMSADLIGIAALGSPLI